MPSADCGVIFMFPIAQVITGAGMMAIPRAYTQIGSLLGTGMLLGVAVLTYWTMAILVKGVLPA